MSKRRNRAQRKSRNQTPRQATSTKTATSQASQAPEVQNASAPSPEAIVADARATSVADSAAVDGANTGPISGSLNPNEIPKGNPSLEEIAGARVTAPSPSEVAPATGDPEDQARMTAEIDTHLDKASKAPDRVVCYAPTTVFTDMQRRLLFTKLPESALRTFETIDGQRVIYVPAVVVDYLANRVFGEMWSFSYEITTIYHDVDCRRGAGADAKFVVFCFACKGRLVIRNADGQEVVREAEGIGRARGRIGDEADMRAAVEIARKGCVTDARKRCFMTFGDAFGGYMLRDADNVIQSVKQDQKARAADGAAKDTGGKAPNRQPANSQSGGGRSGEKKRLVIYKPDGTKAKAVDTPSDYRTWFKDYLMNHCADERAVRLCAEQNEAKTFRELDRESVQCCREIVDEALLAKKGASSRQTADQFEGVEPFPAAAAKTDPSTGGSETAGAKSRSSTSTTDKAGSSGSSTKGTPQATSKTEGKTAGKGSEKGDDKPASPAPKQSAQTERPGSAETQPEATATGPWPARGTPDLSQTPGWNASKLTDEKSAGEWLIEVIDHAHDPDLLYQFEGEADPLLQQMTPRLRRMLAGKFGRTLARLRCETAPEEIDPPHDPADDEANAGPDAKQA
ncbi:hypothetical protein CKO28_04975 [Rhodovibrio sodomensis]|uniref:Uncharacterized protein n=1 Tax=Rhodovibrio sodomensis TaxID=1088 RepID=A0ABS1DAB9_9PROT|nr:Rad52/Rad22 family DNA repair protein [Rhodovibrio sodomensis]MBK1667381.1 hypothetical protein [Rhodovibrio sodomensis]